MGIISDYIKYRLNHELNDSCIISGLPKSGKSHLIGQLSEFNKLEYINEGNDGSVHMRITHKYMIHEMSPLIDNYIMTDLHSTGGLTYSQAKKIINDDNPKIAEESRINSIKVLSRYRMEYLLLKNNIKSYSKNPMFVIYIHNLWDNYECSNIIYDNLELIRDRYIDVVSMIKSLGYHIIVCDNSKILSSNALYLKYGTNIDAHIDENGNYAN